MTVETRRTIALEDLKAIEYECLYCHTKSVRLLDEKNRVASACGNCNRGWLTDGSREHTELQTFVNVLMSFRNSSINQHVGIRFECTGLGSENE